MQPTWCSNNTHCVYVRGWVFALINNRLTFPHPPIKNQLRDQRHGWETKIPQEFFFKNRISDQKVPFLHTLSLNREPKTVDDHQEQLISNKAKKPNSMIRKLVQSTTKMLQKAPFCHFEPPKGYGWVCHRYIGKVTKFGHLRIIIFRRNELRFLVGKEQG